MLLYGATGGTCGSIVLARCCGSAGTRYWRHPDKRLFCPCCTFWTSGDHTNFGLEPAGQTDSEDSLSEKDAGTTRNASTFHLNALVQCISFRTRTSASSSTSASNSQIVSRRRSQEVNSTHNHRRRIQDIQALEFRFSDAVTLSSCKGG